MAKQTFTTGQVLTAAQMTSLQQTAMLGGAASAKTASYTLVAADAGTAISMSNASATTITVNTALFAAGDTVQITNLGAGVCTITAGTATVNSSASLALAQYESGTLDFTSTSAAIFIKGAGGAAAGGGMTLLSTTTLSGTTTTISSIDQTYNNLQMVIKNVNNGTNNPLFVNPNGDASNTQFVVCTTQGGILDQTRFKTHTNIKAGATDNAFILNWIQYASTSSVKSCYGSVGYLVAPSTYWAGTHGGVWFDNSAISSFTITSPTAFTGGTVLLYGVK